VKDAVQYRTIGIW